MKEYEPNDEERIIRSYAEAMWREAYERVEKEMRGEGCGCGSCAYQAVDDINSWTDFIAGECDHGLYYTYDPITRTIHRPDWAERRGGQ